MSERECICGRDAYDGPGKPWLQHGPSCPAPYAEPIALPLAHIAAVLRDEATVEAVGNRPMCEHEEQWWREIGYAIHCTPCDVAVIAERLGVPHVDR